MKNKYDLRKELIESDFISDIQRNVLKECLVKIEKIKSEIKFNHAEYSHINTTIGLLKGAIKEERSLKEYLSQDKRKEE